MTLSVCKSVCSLKFFGKKGDAKKWETNIDRYYIIQGYNKVIKVP